MPITIFFVEMSMLEIYNKEIYDLFQINSSCSTEGSYRRYNCGLNIRRGSDSMIEAIDLKKEKVFCVEDVISILSRGKLDAPPTPFAVTAAAS